CLSSFCLCVLWTIKLSVDGVDLFEPNSSRIVTFLTVMGEPTNPLVSRLYKPSYSLAVTRSTVTRSTRRLVTRMIMAKTQAV
ncbi:hypothetical protein V8E53_001474, partial [Lactarius tabidus]